MNNYVILEKIGDGYNSNVYLASTVKDEKKVAIKIIDKSKIKSEDLETLYNEVSIHGSIDHPNIIKYINSIDDGDTLSIILECMNGELYKKVQREPHKRLSSSVCFNYILQIGNAIEYLHSLNIIHRDIKPENILLSSDHNTVKLCDFGWAIKSTEPQTKFCGTLDYLAPEMIISELRSDQRKSSDQRKRSDKTLSYDYRVDLWAIGVLTYELLTGATPFYAPTYKGTYSNILSVRLSYPSYITGEAIDFISSLIIRDPTKRMEAKDIKYHSWIYLI